MAVNLGRTSYRVISAKSWRNRNQSSPSHCDALHRSVATVQWGKQALPMRDARRHSGKTALKVWHGSPRNGRRCSLTLRVLQ